MATNPQDNIRALKIGYRVEDILNATDSKLIIHSIFENAVNLLGCEDWIITLLPENYSAGPQAIILTQEDFAGFKSLNLKIGDTCNLRELVDTGDAIIISRKEIDNSTLKDISKIQRNKEYFESILYQRGNMNGLLGENSIYSKYAAPILKELESLFLEGKYEQAGKKLLELVGLGPGLTPSGDDFTLGLLAVFSFYQTEEIVSDLRKHLIEKAKSKTNIISFNMLRQAAMGGFPEWVENMAFSVIYENPDEIDRAFFQMLKIGSSSGSDISAGILFGLKLMCSIV